MRIPQIYLLFSTLFYATSAIQTVSTFSPTLANNQNIYGSERYSATIAQRRSIIQAAAATYLDVSVYMLQPNLSNGFMELVIVEPSANEAMRTNIFEDILENDLGCEVMIVFVEDIMEFSRPIRVRLIPVTENDGY